VPIFPRHPLVLASQTLVMEDLAPGRFRLGIGPSHQPTIEGLFGIPFTQPLAYLREYLTILRQILWEGKANFDGERFHVHNASLPPGVTPPRTPLLMSALRANAFHLAGEIADGAISWVCPIPYLQRVALPALQAGAAAAQRPVPPLYTHVPVVVHADSGKARAAAEPFLTRYGNLPYYAQMFRDAGYPPSPDGSASTALFEGLVVSGDATRVASRLKEIQAAGFEELLITLIQVEDVDAEEFALINALK
jgi:alkanesulfonate monooxygenase SsuD/methylene tetrahydromethanopterin reductase-like flavin-dependent oxidoreductase (luciferase family)